MASSSSDELGRSIVGARRRCVTRELILISIFGFSVGWKEQSVFDDGTSTSRVETRGAKGNITKKGKQRQTNNAKGLFITAQIYGGT